MTQELMQREFEPVNEDYMDPIRSGRGKLLYWRYKPEGCPDKLTSDFVVLKPAEANDQYVLGPERAARAVVNAFNILDSCGLPEVRATSVVINPYLSKGKGLMDGGKNFLHELVNW